MSKLTEYQEFLKNKVQLSTGGGLDALDLHPSLFPHQRDAVRWALARGKALLAMKFGMGKTRCQIELLRQVQARTGRKVLVICPLGVRHQFMHEDGPAMDVEFAYVRDDAEAQAADTPFLITNYERVRDGNLSADFLRSEIAGVCLDEGAILGNLGTKTQQQFSDILTEIPYRWVATATPAPNDYRQLIYFADFVDAIDAGQALTRYFGRNPDKAGDLQLLPHMERDFWLFVASWALFVDTPSDLGYDDTGYDMPALELRFHRIAADHEKAQDMVNDLGQRYLFKDTAAGVTQAMREKRDSLQDRVSQTLKVVLQYICNQTFSEGATNEDKTGVQPGVLRGEPREGEGTGAGILSSEQGEDRPRKTQGLHEGVLQNLQEATQDASSEGGDKSKKTRTVRRRSGVSGAPKDDGPQQSISKTGGKTLLSSEEQLRDNTGAIRGDTDKAGRRMRNLRGETNECNDSQGEDRESALHRPRSCDGQSAGGSLSSLQLRSGSVSGQHRVADKSGRLSQEQLVIWCDLNDEQKAIESGLKRLGISFSSIYGSLSPDEAEQRLYEWKNKQTAVLLSKPSILGSGVNLQQAHIAIYAGLDFKFRDFIQSIHRLQRYGQLYTVIVHLIHTDAEDHVVSTLMQKWQQHDALVARMRAIVKEFGLTNEALSVGMQRTLGVTRQVKSGQGWTAVNNDCVIETMTMADNSVDEIVTSIPFGNHYEYVASLNDFGHNQADSDFWTQMDFLIPELLRVLKPGRMACIHVKDRLLYGHQTPHGMMEVDYFTHDCARAFRKHGFVNYGEIFIPTDVVRENNSTNRLGWSECCKDGSKMGVGLSEKVLLFRKPQTDKSRSYADEPVRKDKKDYSRGRWQIDAHSLWRSNGQALESRQSVPTPADDPALLKDMDGSQIYNWYKEWSKGQPYDYHQHVAFNEALGDRLPAKFMLMPPQAPDEYEETVWTDVLFFRTLNMQQAQRRVEKHLCPLPLDIVERLIVRYSNPAEIVFDPFHGLGTVSYMALKLGRKGLGVELNPLYWESSVKYLRETEAQVSAPTLFSLVEDPTQVTA